MVEGAARIVVLAEKMRLASREPTECGPERENSALIWFRINLT